MNSIDYADPSVVVTLVDDILQPSWIKGKVLVSRPGAQDDARVRAIRSVLDQHYMTVAERGH